MRRSSFIFKENYFFIEEEDKPSDKPVIVEEKLDGIGNLVELPKLMFIYEECANLEGVVDGGGVTRKSNRKKKSEVLEACRCQICDKCYRRDWVKHDFSCGYFFSRVGSK